MSIKVTTIFLFICMPIFSADYETVSLSAWEQFPKEQVAKYLIHSGLDKAYNDALQFELSCERRLNDIDQEINLIVQADEEFRKMDSLKSTKALLKDKLSAENKNINAIRSAYNYDEDNTIKASCNHTMEELYRFREKTAELDSFDEVPDDEIDLCWLERKEYTSLRWGLFTLTCPCWFPLVPASLPFMIPGLIVFSFYVNCTEEAEKRNFKEFENNLSQVQKIVFNETIYKEAKKYVAEDIDFIKKHNKNKEFFDNKLSILSKRIEQLISRLDHDIEQSPSANLTHK